MDDCLVLDPSLILSWFIEDEHHDYAQQLRKTLEEGTLALVPSGWQQAIVDMLLHVERSQQIKPTHANQALALIQGLPIRSVDNTAPDRINHCLRIARETGLEADKATLLELALYKTIPLATADEELSKTAKALGIRVNG